MGLLLPKAGFPGCSPPAEDPWETELRSRRELAYLTLTGKLRGAGMVSSGAHAVWSPPTAQLGDPLEELAIRLDAAATRLARGRGALDLAVGEALERLFEGRRLVSLNWARQKDFARGALGIPPRTMYAFLDLARAVDDLPQLRLAVVRGEVSALKAQAIAPAIRIQPESTPFLLQIAATCTLPHIEQILKDLGEEPAEDRFIVRTKRFRMSAAMQAHLTEAIELAKAVVGHGKPRHAYEEIVAMEFLAAHAEFAPEPDLRAHPQPPSGSYPPAADDRARLLSEWENRDTSEIEAALRFLLADERDTLAGAPAATDNPADLVDLITKLLAFRKRWDEPLGRILETISTLRLNTFFGYSSFSRYVRERLGISERAARQRVWLERKMVKMPALRMALLTSRLTYTKALAVARVATPSNVGTRILEAAETTCQQVERKSTEEEDRQNLAAGIRRIWGPEEAMETIEAAITAAKRVFLRDNGVKISDGEAYGLIAASFVDQWRDAARRARLSPLRRRVQARTKGGCATPGCGNPGDHVHHIVYRSDRGPDEEWNLVFMCQSCHRRLHKGRLKVKGRAGTRLWWRILRERGRWECWETLGDDDVRRLPDIGTWT